MMHRDVEYELKILEREKWEFKKTEDIINL